MSATGKSDVLFPTTIAGSLPKPAWLAEPNKLWAPWRLQGDELATAKDDATLIAIKLQEDAGIDIVGDGEQARQHFVHGFLEAVDGIDFNKRVEMGIRNDRYKAMCPTVVGELKLRHRVHAREARLARAHTQHKLKFTLPGPMTIVDTIADAHYGDRIKMATDRLDLDNLAADAGNIAYAGAPGGLRIGHIHLRVGDLGPTQQFYGTIGMMPTAGRGGALFMSSGRYHHHVGSNVWQSAGAGMRDDGRAGLSWFAIEAADAATRDEALARLKGAGIPVDSSAEGSQVRDPFGTRVRLA